VARPFQQIEGSPHWIAATIVQHLGHDVARGTLNAICEQLGHRRSLHEFDAVRHVADQGLPPWEVREAVPRLEYLREAGQALDALLGSR
jgi:hypothetical protein